MGPETDLKAMQERCECAAKAAERGRRAHRTEQWAILYSEDVPALLSRIDELELEVRLLENECIEEGER